MQICYFRKELRLDGCLGFELRRVVIALAENFCNWQSNHFVIRAILLGTGSHAPFELCSGIFPANEKKHGKTQGSRGGLDSNPCIDLAAF
jgi:hypothetical protein